MKIIIVIKIFNILIIYKLKRKESIKVCLKEYLKKKFKKLFKFLLKIFFKAHFNTLFTFQFINYQDVENFYDYYNFHHFYIYLFFFKQFSNKGSYYLSSSYRKLSLLDNYSFGVVHTITLLGVTELDILCPVN